MRRSTDFGLRAQDETTGFQTSVSSRTMGEQLVLLHSLIILHVVVVLQVAVVFVHFVFLHLALFGLLGLLFFFCVVFLHLSVVHLIVLSSGLVAFGPAA